MLKKKLQQISAEQKSIAELRNLGLKGFYQPKKEGLGCTRVTILNAI